MRLQEKSLSKLKLTDILRKKRKNLQSYLTETGIVTYERLVRSCTSIGVTPPTEQEFKNAIGNPLTPEISSPTDGILVLNPPTTTEDVPADFSTAMDHPENQLNEEDTTTTQRLKRGTKKKLVIPENE